MRGLYVGRFQPFHNGHLAVVRHIQKTFHPAELLIGIGSAQHSHTLRDPFSAGERFLMVTGALRSEEIGPFQAIPIPDLDRHALWVPHVESLVPPFEEVYSNDPLTRMLFEEGGYRVPEIPFFQRGTLEGREIRRRMIAGENWHELVPPHISQVIEEIHGIERLRTLARSPQG